MWTRDSTRASADSSKAPLSSGRRVPPTLVAVAVFLISALSTLAQSTTITGVVQDNQGVALPGVRIDVTKDGRSFSAVTDGQGRYSLVLPGPDEYEVVISLAGFATERRRVTVAPNQAASVDFRLSDSGSPTPPVSRPPPVTTAPTPPPPPTSTAPPPPATHATITVFFATDRGKTGSAPLPYGSARQADGSLHLGQVDIHVPREHRIGYVERPTWWRLYREDSDKDFVVTRFQEQPDASFYGDLRATIGKSRGKQAFVFVHGFNVAFDAAVYRTAQLAYDLDFDGAPILYSWPSQGTLTGYPIDQTNNDWTVAHLQVFLRQVSAQSGAQTIHLIAHSMGNRALTNALAQMAAATPAASRPHFNQLVLTAPDVDASIFKTLAAQFQPLVQRATLYASSKDEALVASRRFNGYQRAGDTIPTVVILQGLDTIDVSNVDSNLIGHFYYGDNRSVISDLKYLLDGVLPGMRATLAQARAPDGLYWMFRR